jgi:flagellar motor switch protein FliM
MSQVLDQAEIDALLESTGPNADDGPASETGQADRPGSAPAGTRRAARSVPTYDFKRPERVSKDQIRAISAIHEVFSRDLGPVLSGLLRTIVDVRVVGVEQLTYNEFLQTLPDPTCLMILQAPPLERQMCLEISPLIVFPVIDRLLGGDNSNLFVPQRPLTMIEWRLVGRIADRTLEHLSEAWRALGGAHFQVVGTESSPQLVHIATPTDVVVLIAFEIRLGQTTGTMSLCVPFNAIEPALNRLTSRSRFANPTPATDSQQKRLVRNVVKSPVNLTAYLGQTTIRLSELRELRPGDLIPLEKRIDRDLILRVGGRNKFAGKVGQFRGHRALRITRRADIDEVL